MDDDVVDGTVSSAVTVSVVDAVSDDNFDAVADQTVSVSTTDDDVAGFTIVELDGSTKLMNLEIPTPSLLCLMLNQTAMSFFQSHL